MRLSSSIASLFYKSILLDAIMMRVYSSARAGARVRLHSLELHNTHININCTWTAFAMEVAFVLLLSVWCLSDGVCACTKSAENCEPSLFVVVFTIWPRHYSLLFVFSIRFLSSNGWIGIFSIRLSHEVRIHFTPAKVGFQLSEYCQFFFIFFSCHCE